MGLKTSRKYPRESFTGRVNQSRLKCWKFSSCLYEAAYIVLYLVDYQITECFVLSCMSLSAMC